MVLMIVLPLVYLFWWKKGWRLMLGASILVVLIVGFFVPGELTYSVLASQLEKESENKIRKIDELINNVAKQENRSEDQEKIDQAKQIVKLNEEMKEERKNQNSETFFWKKIQRNILRQG